MLQRKTTTEHHPLSLVVETDDPALAICDFVGFASAGFDVVVCLGPGPDRRCAAVDGHECAAISGADVVLNAMLDSPARAAVLEAVRNAVPDVPLVVSIEADNDTPLPAGCIPMPDTVSVPGQTAILRRVAVAHRQG